ncbi:MAG: formate dehydrogenase subunit alpha [Hyphomicrobiaceae bacterium]|nr:formate dehydrogenase subunit alpha [Hyphomicrobiaceae bacterium]
MSANTTKTKTITFELDGRTVEALPDETIWQVAKRAGTKIPHLCWLPEPGYRSDGNCRACMVEIEGERVLAASCQRKPSAGMKVKTASERAKKSREMVFELLIADQPAKEDCHDPRSKFWTWVGDMGVATTSRFPGADKPAMDTSHAAIAVNLDACINCGLCVRACREVQHNDVIGMAYRGSGAKVVFDFDNSMGNSTCVACGECVQACPTGALMEANLLDAAGKRVAYEDHAVDTLCPYCGVGCQTKVHVKDNKILYVDGRNGPANENRLCVKGRFGFDYIHHKDRLTKPLIRRDGVAKDANMQLRREDIDKVFREATWDEALERAAMGLKRIADQHGGKALAGFGSAKGSNEEAYLFQKFIRQGFGTNNVDHCTRLCHASSVAALMEGLNSGAVTAPFMAAEDSDCMIVIGARPAQNHPVAATYIKNAAARGAKLIIMDPRGQSGDSYARYASHILQFKPGMDVALLNAMLNVIVTEGLVDIQYVQAHTEGYDALKQAVQSFEPEKMAPVCGIPADTIREVARLYAKSERSIIFWGMGVSQHTHGTDNARCLIALALVTGQIGRRGTGLHPLRGQNNVQGASDAGLIPMVYPDYISVEDPATRARYERLWGTKLDPKRGLTVVEIMKAIHDGEIRGMYVMGENPAMSDPDVQHAREAMAHLEHMVVQDIFLTETAWHADVVLPASAHAEKWGTFTNTNRTVQLARPVVDPPGEARQDWMLIQELAQRVGLKWTYRNVSEVFTEMASVMPSLDNITWDRLVDEGSVTYPCDDPTKPGNEIIFATSFPTKSGRAKLVPAKLLAPDEMPDEEYPLVLTTGRMLEHWHTGSMTRRASNLDSLEPEAVASLNPREIERLGLVPGERIEVATRRGVIELKCRADRDVPEGMVFIPFCFAEASANMLTNPKLDPMGKIPEFKYCAARVDRIAAQVEAAE